MNALDVVLPADPKSPGVIRRELQARLQGFPDCEDIVLCASELVTNAVLHARTPLRVVMSARDGRIRLAVHDDDPSPPVMREADLTAPSGRGLHLVSVLSAAWGSERSGAGKVVWAEFEDRGQGLSRAVR